MPNWFESWFDTEYYHSLYNKRDENEAEAFILALMDLLSVPKGSHIADIACGKGRHSRVLARMEMHVSGYDLSENSIAYATSLAGAKEQYQVHDMRMPYAEANLDAAMNIFTSFGYFEHEEEDAACIANIFNMLRPGGWFIQDYLQASAVLPSLPQQGSEQREDVQFLIRKYIKGTHIHKDITVMDAGQEMHFQELVKVYSAEQLRVLHEAAGFQVKHIFGDYLLNPLVENQSPRIILVSQKPIR